MFVGSKGKSAHLLKPSSKRKRTKAELEELKEEEKLFSKDKKRFLEESKKAKEDRNALEGALLEYQNDHEIV